MSDTSLVLGVNSSIFQSRVLSSGLALQLSAATFNRKLQQLPKLRQLLNRYVYVQQAQLALTAACNRFHTLDQRLARWLLMTNDRADLSNFHLTHKLLGQILGVRRAGVTESAGNLQEGGIVSYRRGEIRVLSHIALEKASCTCYKASIDIYERVLR